jgi:hypothetical protein
MGRHSCNYPPTYMCTSHVKVFGDLLPIEQYRNGSDGRRHLTGDPFNDLTVSLLLRQLPRLPRTFDYNL